MAITNNGNRNSNPPSILGNLRQQVTEATRGNAREEFKKADFWLNVGVTVVNEANEETFISLPQGLPLDDMKPQVIRGSNQDWIHLAQSKNLLLAELQKAAAGLAPGERLVVGQLQVELRRAADPAQEGNPSDNPLMAQLVSTLAGRKAG